ALVAAALDRRVAAAAVPSPTCGAEKPNAEPTDERFQKLQTIFVGGNVGRTPGPMTGPLPGFSSDQLGALSLLKPIQAFKWFIDYGGRHGTLWENRVTRVIPPTPVPFSAYLAAPYIRAATFMTVGRHDEVVY